MKEIRHNIVEDGIQFYIVSDGAIISHAEWNKTPDCDVYSDILKECVVNGNAIYNEKGVLLEFRAMYDFTRSELKALGLPTKYPHKISISETSLLKDTNFKYKVSYRTSEGDRLPVKRKALFVYYEGEEHFLSEQQYDLIEAIDAFNDIEEDNKSFNGNLIAFDRIKGLSNEAQAVLGKYLKNENVFVPSKLKIEIERNGANDYSLRPTIEHPLDVQFDRYLGQYDKAPDSINLSYDNNERVRVVFSDKQKSVISKIKKEYEHVPKEKLLSVVECPELVLDPETCDVSEFYSDRVIEIGLYKPKYTSFVSPFKSSWIPSFMIEDRVNGSTSISFETLEELQEFAICIHESEIAGKESVDYKGVILNIDDARKIYEHSKKKIEDYNKEKKEKEVLIIEENDESLGYSEAQGIDLSIKKYDFAPIRGLKENVRLKEHQIEGVA